MEDVDRSGVEVGGEESLRLELAFGIADEQPADRHRRHTGAIPHGGAGGDLDEAIGAAVPEADAVALPDCADRASSWRALADACP